MDEGLLVRGLELDHPQPGAVEIVNDQLRSLQVQVFFAPAFLQRFETVEDLGIVGFFFEVLVGLTADLEAAEALLEVVGAVGFEGLLDAFVLGDGTALHVG